MARLRHVRERRDWRFYAVRDGHGQRHLILTSLNLRELKKQRGQFGNIPDNRFHLLSEHLNSHYHFVKAQHGRQHLSNLPDVHTQTDIIPDKPVAPAGRRGTRATGKSLGDFPRP